MATSRTAPALLLGCGILSSLVYGAQNVLGTLLWPGYGSLSQTVSELSAIDAPSRAAMVPLSIAYGLLVVAFGLGVRATAGRDRGQRATAALLVAFGVVCLLGPYAPMHRREVLATGGGTLSDMLHLALTAVDVILIVLIIASAARAFGRRFRTYSTATVVVLLAAGAPTSLDADRVAHDLPTPWAGLFERICIGAFLLWICVFSIALIQKVAVPSQKTCLSNERSAGSNAGMPTPAPRSFDRLDSRS